MPVANKKQVLKKNGFSLTELSIVIVIIAFLISAILKGQNLVNEARVQSIVSEVANLQVAANSFYIKYRKYPGDFDEAAGATTGNWWAVSAITKDGDNNSKIEFKNTATTPVYEGYVAWQHLSLAGMLTSPYPGSASVEPTLNTGAAVPGTDVPLSKSGGGYLIDYSSSASAYDATTAGAYGILEKNIMALGVPLATSASPVKVGGIITPGQAMSLDTKMDDGAPITGSVRGADGSGATAGNCISAGVYKISLSGKDCVMIFQISNQ